MTSRGSSNALRELVDLLARYSTAELSEALRVLDDPERLNAFLDLLARAFEISKQRSPSRTKRSRSSDDDDDNGEHLRRVLAKRPSEAVLIGEIVDASRTVSWTRDRIRRVDEVVRRYTKATLGSSRARAAREAQLLGVLEVAPTSVLAALASELGANDGGTLQEWSDIILKDRKRPRRT